MASLKRNPSTGAPLKPPFPYIATPAYGGMVTASYLAGLRALSRSLDGAKVKHHLDITGNESLITRARNGCVARFLKTECTHLIFIDADIGFGPEDVAKLVWADFDVCGGAYPMKAIGWGNVAAAVKEGQPTEKLAKLGGLYAVSAKTKDEHGNVDVIERAGSRFLEVHDLATGFMCIKREALEKFIAHYGKSIAYTPDDPQGAAPGEIRYNVFHADMDPVQVAEGNPAPRYLSEDYYFCRRWQQMGGKTYVCIDVALTHTGTFRFDGDISLLIEDDKEPSAPQPEAPSEGPTGFSTAEVEAILSGEDAA